VRELAAQSLEKRWQRVVGPVDRLAAMPPQGRHRVRIDAKKLRYGCEFFASLYADGSSPVATGSGAEPSGPLAFASQVEQVQSALGAVNDHAVADGLLRSVGSSAPAVDEHDLVDDAVDAARALAALDPFWR
jgi:CHAD domain-containing protein